MAHAWPCRCCKEDERKPRRSPIAPSPDGEGPRDIVSRWARHFQVGSFIQQHPLHRRQLQPGDHHSSGVDCLQPGDFKFRSHGPWMANTSTFQRWAHYGEQGAALPCSVIPPTPSFPARRSRTGPCSRPGIVNFAKAEGRRDRSPHSPAPVHRVFDDSRNCAMNMVPQGWASSAAPCSSDRQGREPVHPLPLMNCSCRSSRSVIYRREKTLLA